MLPLLLAQATPEPRCTGQELGQAVATVAARTQAMDAAGLAELFEPDGQSVGGGRVLTGRDEIRRFIQGFSAYHLRSESMTVASIAALDGAWRTEGRFAQEGTTPQGAAYHSEGSFAIIWRCSADGWRIRRMETGA